MTPEQLDGGQLLVVSTWAATIIRSGVPASAWLAALDAELARWRHLDGRRLADPDET